MQKLFKVLVVALIFTFLLASCAKSTDKRPNQDKIEPKTIKIGLLRIDDSLPFFVAEEENIYVKNNVNVELISFNSARDKDLALEAGEIDAVLADLIVAGLMKKGGTDIKVISLGLGATPQEGRFALLAAPNSGIEKPEDLKGVPIAISNNTIIHFLAEKMTQEVGLNKKDIKTQSIPDIKLRLEALLEGKDVQAAILPDPLVALAEKSGAKVVIDDTKLTTNLSQSVIIFRNDVINKHNDAVAAVMKSYQEAARNLNQDPEKYRSLIIEKARVPKPLVDSYPSPTYSPSELPTVEMVSRVMDWMVEKGLLEKAYSYEEMVDTSFVK